MRVNESGGTPAGYGDHGTWIEVPTTLGGKLTFYFAASGGHVAGEWAYLAPTNAAGAETFNYTIVDGDGDTASANLAINVVLVNEAPAGASATLTVNEDAQLTLTAANFGFTDPSDVPPIHCWRSRSPRLKPQATSS